MQYKYMVSVRMAGSVMVQTKPDISTEKKAQAIAEALRIGFEQSDYFDCTAIVSITMFQSGTNIELREIK